MRPLLTSLSPSLIAFLVQSVVVSSIAVLAAHFGAKRGPTFRIAVHRAGILTILVLLFAGPIARLAVHPWWVIGSPTSANGSAKTFLGPDNDPSEMDASGTIRLHHRKTIGSAALVGAKSESVDPDITATATSSVAATGESFTSADLAGLAWACGAGLLLLLVVAGSLWVLCLRRTPDSPLSVSLRQSIEVLCRRLGVDHVYLATSRDVRSAFVVGVLNPTIYLPGNVETEFGRDQIEAMLCHEVVHVKQGDCLWALLSKLCCAVSWPNPFVWVMARQMTLSSEELCDQLVLESGVEPAIYAGCLLRVAETTIVTSPARLVGAGVFPAKSHLSRRISRMLNSSSNPKPTLTRNLRLKIASVAVASAIGACIFVSAAAPLASRRDETPEATIHAFCEALNKQDWQGVFSRIEDAKVSEAVRAFGSIPKNQLQLPILSPYLSKFTTTGDTATGHVILKSLMPKGFPVAAQPDEDVVTLHRSNGDWRIVGDSREHSVIANIVSASQDPEKVKAAWQRGSLRVAILSNLKQLSLAALLYANDHDDKYPSSPAALKAAIGKYVQNNKVWLGPDGKPMNVRLNAAIAGKSGVEIEQPAVTVMLSLGTKGNLEFVNDMTPIAFCDGHVKYMRREAIAYINWTPVPSNVKHP